LKKDDKLKEQLCEKFVVNFPKLPTLHFVETQSDPKFMEKYHSNICKPEHKEEKIYSKAVKWIQKVITGEKV